MRTQAKRPLWGNVDRGPVVGPQSIRGGRACHIRCKPGLSEAQRERQVPSRTADGVCCYIGLVTF
jgi:hypothetical protein